MVQQLLENIRLCTICSDLPLGPRPVLQVGERGRILVAGQAPGLRVHETGIPFNDPSGDRLRHWMGVSSDTFYDPEKIIIVPMGFCYPGRNPKGGDIPPRRECRQTWHDRLFQAIPKPKLALVIGQYAQAYHLGDRRSPSLTETVRRWREFGPDIVPMPHPSPRNNIWLKKNPWFEREVIGYVRRRIAEILAG